MSAALIRKLQQAQQRLHAGDARAAHALCEQVLRAAPRNPEALFLFGVTQLALGRARDAIAPLTQALAVDTRNAAALENLGLAHLMLEEFSAAEQALAKAARHPRAPASVFMRLGIALLELGRATEALQALRRALALDPVDSNTHLNLGRALVAGGQFAAAREHFQTALRLEPQCADAQFNLGVLAMQQRDAGQAREHYLAALRMAPGLTAAHQGLAVACLALGRAGEAVPHLQAALEAQPSNTEALALLASAMFELGQLDDALTAARSAVRLNAADAASYATIANVFLVRGDFEQAIATLESGYAQTQASGLLGMLVYQLRQVCDWTKWRSAWASMQLELERSASLGSPFWLLCEPTSAQQQLQYARRWAAERFGNIAALARIAGAQAHPDTRLRLGYLSSDLHQHATAYLIAEVLERHDRERFEVFAYSYGPEDESAMRQRLRAACEHFIDIAWEPDDSVAQRIKSDNLDILVDLKGYTTGDRLGIMAYRPCGIQVTWLGYPGTTGAPFIDYVVADRFVIPPGAESAYSEHVLRMPHCYQPNDRKRAAGETSSRAEYGLPADGFVFCCFNQTYKITAEMFAVWMQLLHAVPASVLWLFEGSSLAKHHLLAHARDAGVTEERIVFAPRLPNAQHLARYAAADLALDTFPYTSHTTLSDALWCGCPALALCGDTFASRVSGSILSAGGMSDLVTYSLADYASLAQRIASDPDLARRIRERVAQAHDGSALFDSASFTRALEGLYLSLCAKHPVRT